MIIFDIDGVLANCEHRKHFIDPNKNPNYIEIINPGWMQISDGWYQRNSLLSEKNQDSFRWVPDYKAYDEACELDEPIEAVVQTMRRHSQHEEIQIWTGRSESVSEKTIDWLYDKIPLFAPRSWFYQNLKMRPIGNNEPTCDLKNRWLNEYMSYPKNDPIEMVFDAEPNSIHMWRRHGIFVFDCRQG